MVRLARYLRPFWHLIGLTIVLLFAQAYCDLELPRYLSHIVNVGIQQGGVEDAVPRAIRRHEFTRVLIFVEASERAAVGEAYVLIDRSSPDYDRWVKEYPVLAETPIYVRRQIDRAQIDQLNPVMGRALLAVHGLEQALADPAKSAEMFGGEAAAFDLSKLPPGVDVFALLAKLPPEKLAPMLAAVDARFAALGGDFVIQAATAVVKSEYAALGMDTGRLQMEYILQTGAKMLLVSLAIGVCMISVGLLAARIGAGLARDVRRDLFRHVESFSAAEFDRFSTASLITRTTNDVTQIQMVVIMFLRMVFYAPIVGIFGVLRAIELAASMWWILALAVVVLFGLVVGVFIVALPRFQIIQTLIDRLNLVLRENLAGLMVIRAFNREDFELMRFDRANRDVTATLLFVGRIMVVMMPLIMLVMNCLALLIVWVGAHEVAAARMQVGDMMAFVQYAMQIFFSFLMLSMMFIVLPRASVAGDRIAEVLAAVPVVQDPPEPQGFGEKFVGTVEFRNVSFRYPGAEADVLHDISFTVRPGEVTAIIGSTGSGKSTVVNLIPRFYDVTAGAILVSGVDIRQVPQRELRDKIGYIPQKSILFSGTVESNLRYAAENADAAALRAAAEAAQAWEFIAARPEGLAAEIAQGGQNVSGGQKQRLTIARALVKKAPIYIFDDSFSALDFKTDVALRRALRTYAVGSTVLVVTQRISSIKHADQIIVLEEGRIAGRGTHRELMETCEPYLEIALSQLDREAWQ